MKKFLCLLLLSGAPALPVVAATDFTASLDAAQVNPPFGVEGDPAGSGFTGTASLQFQPAAGGEGPRLSYRLDLPGLDLDGNLTPGDFGDDVTAIHIHTGAGGGNGPHVLNVLGFSGGQIREDDADLLVNIPMSFVTGVWDDGDQLFTGPNGARQLFDSGSLSAHVDELQAGNLYFQVHTLNFPNGELRGQIVPVPEPGALVLLCLGGFLLAAKARSRRAIESVLPNRGEVSPFGLMFRNADHADRHT